MTDKKEAEKILNDFLATASPKERRELRHLLDERKKNPMSLKEMDISGVAKNMAEDLQKTMGLTQDNIRRTAIDMVVRLARQHQPDISDRELSALVREMVPGQDPAGAQKLPPEMIKAMILQFVTYSTGEMSSREQRELPEGWAQKYWDHFPVPVRGLIKNFLQGNMGRSEFWKKVSAQIESPTPPRR